MTAMLPDAMPDIRHFLRNHPFLSGLSAGRVFFRIPDAGKISVSPFIHLYWTGGGLQPDSEAPIADVSVALAIWGMDRGDYGLVRETSIAIQNIAFMFSDMTVLGPGGTIGKYLKVTTGVDSPDPDTGWARIVLQTTWTVSS